MITSTFLKAVVAAAVLSSTMLTAVPARADGFGISIGGGDSGFGVGFDATDDGDGLPLPKLKKKHPTGAEDLSHGPTVELGGSGAMIYGEFDEGLPLPEVRPHVHGDITIVIGDDAGKTCKEPVYNGPNGSVTKSEAVREEAKALGYKSVLPRAEMALWELWLAERDLQEHYRKVEQHKKTDRCNFSQVDEERERDLKEKIKYWEDRVRGYYSGKYK